MILMMGYYGVIWMANLDFFSVACAWDSLRTKADLVEWFNISWFPHCIPRHAIHLWLVIKEKLKTQDRLRLTDVGPNVDLNLLRYPLCDAVPDSHPHLFFECPFSLQVWLKVPVFIRHGCGLTFVGGCHNVHYSYC